MVAQQTATATRKPTKAARKPVYRPRITFLSATEYLMPSERFAGHIIYKVTVHASGRAQCECRAADLGRACKHRRLALAAHAYRAHPTHLRPATQEMAAASVAPVVIAPAPAFIPAPPAFSQLFAA